MYSSVRLHLKSSPVMYQSNVKKPSCSHTQSSIVIAHFFSHVPP
jgi:hypothetical protein